jgi:hypothetical protein
MTSQKFIMGGMVRGLVTALVLLLAGVGKAQNTGETGFNAKRTLSIGIVSPYQQHSIRY